MLLSTVLFCHFLSWWWQIDELTKDSHGYFSSCIPMLGGRCFLTYQNIFKCSCIQIYLLRLNGMHNKQLLQPTEYLRGLETSARHLDVTVKIGVIILYSNEQTTCNWRLMESTSNTKMSTNSICSCVLIGE